MVLVPLLLLLAGASLIAVGIVLLARRGRLREHTAPRVPVAATVVRQVGLRQPPILEVDYPGPDGRVLRGQVKVPMGSFGQALLTGGDPTTVWVDPRRPGDPSLEQGGESASASVFVGIILLFFGSTALLIALVSFVMLVLIR